MINVPENIVGDLMTGIRDVMNGVSPAIIVFIGISIAFFAVREIKRLMPKSISKG